MVRALAAPAISDAGRGNVGLVMVVVAANGGENAAMPNALLNGPSVSWYTPAPPRTAVRPLPATSHANPTRGATFRRDGLSPNGGPTVKSASVKMFRSVVSRPLASAGIEYAS